MRGKAIIFRSWKSCVTMPVANLIAYIQRTRALILREKLFLYCGKHKDLRVSFVRWLLYKKYVVLHAWQSYSLIGNWQYNCKYGSWIVVNDGQHNPVFDTHIPVFQNTHCKSWNEFNLPDRYDQECNNKSQLFFIIEFLREMIRQGS